MIAAFGLAILCLGRTAAFRSGRCCFYRTRVFPAGPRRKL